MNSQIKIKTEKDLRDFLASNGFAVNYNKHDNEIGSDIVAIKDGYAFFIEFKNVELREIGTYRYSGEVNSDILFLSLPCGSWTFWNHNNSNSLTKTCRFFSLFNK